MMGQQGAMIDHLTEPEVLGRVFVEAAIQQAEAPLREGIRRPTGAVHKKVVRRGGEPTRPA